MKATDLIPSSACYLRLLEDQRLTGAWSWDFATGEQAWTPGFFHLLGLDPHDVRPSYGRFLDRVHPEDRLGMESPGDVVQGHLMRTRQFRIIRPDGSMRVLSASSEVRFTPDDRPRSAFGVVSDVTENDRLVRARQAERKRRGELFLRAGILHYTTTPDGRPDLVPEVAQVIGRPLEEFIADPLADIVPEDRATFRDDLVEGMIAGRAVRAQARYRIVKDQIQRVGTLLVPVYGSDGAVVEFNGLSHRLDEPSAVPLPDRVRLGLEQSLRGAHLRAARALLDWSMTTLAQASGLSLSTVRRLEEDGEMVAARSRHVVVGALRTAGIRFVLMGDGRVAVAKD